MQYFKIFERCCLCPIDRVTLGWGSTDSWLDRRCVQLGSIDSYRVSLEHLRTIFVRACGERRVRDAKRA